MKLVHMCNCMAVVLILNLLVFGPDCIHNQEKLDVLIKVGLHMCLIQMIQINLQIR